MKYELIIVWSTGEKEKHLYNTYEEAKQAADNMEMAFGSQLWAGINERGTA